MWVSLSPFGINNNVGQGTGSQVLDSANDMVAWIFTATEAHAITSIKLRVDQVVSPPTYKVSINAIDTSTSLKPDLATEHASGTFTPSVGVNTVSVSHTLTAGTTYAIVVQHSSGTISGSNDARFQYGSSIHQYSDIIALRSTNAGSSWSYFGYGGIVSCHGSGGYLFGDNTTDVGDSAVLASAGDRACQKISIASVAGAHKIKGFGFPLVGGSANADTIKFGIWDSSGTLLATAVQAAVPNARFSGTNAIMTTATFATAYTMSASTDYYLGAEAIDGETMNLRMAEYASNADLGDHNEGTSGIYLATWDGSSWTETNTKRVLMAVLFEDSGGGGGGVISNAPLFTIPA